MSIRLPYKDGEPLIEKLEEAVEAGDADFIEVNMLRLENLIAAYQNRIFELARLQQRAREIREQHEPPADGR